MADMPSPTDINDDLYDELLVCAELVQVFTKPLFIGDGN
jgi:hypothetical protein